MSDYIQIFILLAILTQAIIAWISFIYFRKQEKRRETLQFLSDTREMREKRRYNLDNGIGADNSIDIQTCSNSDLVLFVQYMDVWEHLAAGVNMGIYDIDVVERTSGGTALNVYDRFNKAFKQMRDRFERPKLYLEFEEMCKKISMIRTV